MIIKTLVENTSKTGELKSEHGLSLYIETKKHKLLFDTGSSELYSVNAAKMGVDLAKVDIAVISHGHYDHGGGLETFLKINKKAKIYMHRNSLGKYYSNSSSGEKEYIGLNEGLADSGRFIFTKERSIIDEGLELFSGVKGNQFNPSGNKDLFKLSGGTITEDDFDHEQSLIIKEGEKTVLLAGCAHTGIVNIMEYFRKEKGFMPSCVIGGFHLYNCASGESEDPAVVGEIGAYLLRSGARCYTCHCTGMESYHELKAVMGENINYLSTGDQLLL